MAGTSYIQLNGNTGNATFIGKVDIGNQYTGGEILKLGKSSAILVTQDIITVVLLMDLLVMLIN